MAIKHGNIVKIVLVVVTFLIIVILIVNYRVSQYEQRYSQIKIGQKREAVINIMGEPSENKDCNSSAHNQNIYSGDICSEIYGYFTSFQYWAVSFDKDGNVIKKFHWTFDDGYGKPDEFGLPLGYW